MIWIRANSPKSRRLRNNEKFPSGEKPSQKTNKLDKGKLRLHLSSMFRNKDDTLSALRHKINNGDNTSVTNTADAYLPNLKMANSNVKFNTMSNFIKSQNERLPKVAAKSGGSTFRKSFK